MVDLKKQHERGSSDWSSLPEDLKVAILCRLPEKPLIASKRVSKDWYFLISYVCIPKLSPPSPSAPICGVFGPCFTNDPSKSSKVGFSRHGRSHIEFCRRHRWKNILGTVGTYLDSFPFTCTTKDLLDCCNGLLLISHFEGKPSQYLVCNPATRETIFVPVNPKHQNSNLVDCSLVFDPSDLLEYKVIRFVHSVGKATIRLLDVYFSEIGEWIEYKLPLQPEVPGIGPFKNSVYLNGVLYKITVARCLICIAIRHNTDLGNLNAWTTIELPNQCNEKEYAGTIGASSRGYLHYFSRDASHFLVWMLQNDAQWVLNHSISIYSLRQSSYANYYCKELGNMIWPVIQPCVLLPSLDDLDEILIETPWFLVTYSLKNKVFELYDVDMRGCETRRLGQTFAYSRSLVVLGSIRRHLLH